MRKQHTTGVTYLQADTDQQGRRLDNFLVAHLKDVPKSRLYRLMRTGEIRVNGGRCKPGQRLETGDRVRLPPLTRTADGDTPVPPDWLPELPVLYEDKDVLVIDKPAGIAVHRGSGIRAGLIETLRHRRARVVGDAEARDSEAPPEFLELVHRLDRDTSGCLLLARNRPALLALHRQWREAGVGANANARAGAGSIEKCYLALLCGKWRGGTRRVSAPLERNRLRAGERLSRVAPQAHTERARPALSIICPRRRFNEYTFVEIRLITGRTHQARVHAASLGHALAGDRKYGEREQNRALRALGLRRLFLHAHRLRFQHPRTGRPLEIEAALPEELQQVLERCSSP